MSSQEPLLVEDFGAGSLKKSSTKRTVSQIAKSAIIPASWQGLLASMAKHYKPKRVLELGTSLGVSSIGLAQALPEASIVSVEGSPEVATFARSLAERKSIDNLTIETAQFDQFLPTVLRSDHHFEWVLIDGNHTYDATMRYFEWLVPNIKPGDMLLFDDIYWSKGMTEAGQEMVDHPKSILTIDLYRWGLIFFPENTEKQHFTLKTGIAPWNK